MPNFENKPEKDPQAAMEELKRGRVKGLDKEKREIIDRALVEGRNPEEALREYEERLNRATGLIRESQKEKAIDKLEREMNEQFKDKKESE